MLTHWSYVFLALTHWYKPFPWYGVQVALIQDIHHDLFSGWMSLTHWGRVTHVCVSKLTIIGSDNGLSPSWRQAIILTNTGLWLIGPLGTKFSEISIAIDTLSFKKMHLKMLSGKWRPFCLGLDVLKNFDVLENRGWSNWLTLSSWSPGTISLKFFPSLNCKENFILSYSKLWWNYHYKLPQMLPHLWGGDMFGKLFGLDVENLRKANY